MSNTRILAMVLAGGKGTRLSPLTVDRAKPAVPFAGGYRIIDFVLSNLVNAGLRRIVVLTQYKSHSLNISEPDFEIYYDEWGNSYNIVIVEPLHEMMVAAAQDGFYYTIVSGYRSMDEQAYNRQSRIDSYLSEGHSHEEANILTDQFYAPHNASEHTSGLALDLVGIEWSEGLHTDYAYQPSAQWLANNAHRFGFILRYMEGKSDITGYHYEPWHFRYVGKEHATFMYKHGLTLEEYLELIAYRGKKLP